MHIRLKEHVITLIAVIHGEWWMSNSYLNKANAEWPFSSIQHRNCFKTHIGSAGCVEAEHVLFFKLENLQV